MDFWPLNAVNGEPWTRDLIKGWAIVSSILSHSGAVQNTRFNYIARSIVELLLIRRIQRHIAVRIRLLVLQQILLRYAPFLYAINQTSRKVKAKGMCERGKSLFHSGLVRPLTLLDFRDEPSLLDW